MRRAALRLLVTAALLFCRNAAAQDYKIAFVYGLPLEQAILVMDPDGSNVKWLTRWESQRNLPSQEAFKTLSVTDGAWSPDGQRILFYGVRAEDVDITSKYKIPFHAPLFVMSAAGGGMKRLLDVPVVAGSAL